MHPPFPTAKEFINEIDMLKERIRELENSLAELQHAAEQFREKEKRYELLMEKMTDSVWILDRDLRMVYISPSVEKMLGFAPEELIAQDIRERLTPSSRAVIQDVLAREMERERHGGFDPERSITLEVENYHKDGSVRWLEVIISAIRSDKGELTGFHGVSRNITKRRRVEESLQQTRDNFRRSFDDSPLGVRIVSADGETIYANRALLDIYGYASVDELRRTPAKDRYLPERYTEFEERRQQRRRGEEGPREYEIGIIRKDGQIRHLRALRKEILWDGVPQYQVIYQDITERKRWEAELRKSEEYFRELIQNISDMIITVDGQGIITYVSPSVERLAGYHPAELSGRSVFDFIVPEDLPRAMSDFARLLLGEGAELPSSFRVRHKDGRVVIMEGVAKNLLHNPSIASVVGNIRDVTEKRQADEERSRLVEKLQFAQKMEALGTLAGGVAHDFNNLLTGIQGHVAMSLQQCVPDQPIRERLMRIGEIVDSGAKLTRQLLGFARGEKKEVRPANMNDLLDQTLQLFGRTKREISIQRNYAPELWAVEVDQGQMEQVFMNLYVNAWQAMPVSGEIYLETQNILLDHSGLDLPGILKPGRYVKVSVSDNGIGMDAKTKAQIFDPFFTTKDKEGGTGLGLTTVYTIIKGHEGTIDVVSAPGQGTTFNIYLPASEKQIDGPRQEAKEILTGTETILIVDDEDLNREVTGELLESMGYKVYKAGSGQEAVAVYMEKKNRIDLIMLDMIMPGISGGETFDLLREINPNIPVLLTSGYNINKQVRQILDRGCNGFLQKPFHPEKLSRKIREILG